METHGHGSELEQAADSARKNKIANIATATIKFVAGVIARDPVLASEAGHDIGDANVHGDHEKEITADTDVEARKFALRSAYKLGVFSLAGAGVEVVVENSLSYSPNKLVGFFVAVGSLAVNRYLKRDAHQHTHDRAHSLRSHTYWDQWVSGVTLANASMALADANVHPAIPIAAHIGLSFASSIEIYRHKPEAETDKHPTEE